MDVKWADVEDGRSAIVVQTYKEKGALLLPLDELESLPEVDLYILLDKSAEPVGWLPAPNVLCEENILDHHGEEKLFIRREELLSMSFL